MLNLYENKYLKYKQKYLTLKKQLGGVLSDRIKQIMQIDKYKYLIPDNIDDNNIEKYIYIINKVRGKYIKYITIEELYLMTDTQINDLITEIHIDIPKNMDKIDKIKNLIIILEAINKKPCTVALQKVSKNIYNCLYLPLKNIKYIIGPHMYQEYNYLDKHIFIFGESHLHRQGDFDEFIKDNKPVDMNINNTILFSSLIHTLTQTYPNKQYDLFLEVGSVIQKKYNKSDFNEMRSSEMIYNTINQFEECFIPEKRKDCKYKNLRTHYTNFRDFMVNEKQNISNMVTFYYENKNLNKLFDYIISNEKLQKQINAISSNYINKDIIINWFKTNFDNEIINIEKSKETNLFLLLMNINSFIMDMYSITRIFRDFTSGSKSTDIIYYCGFEHAKRFKLFMNDIQIKPILDIKTDHAPPYYLELNVSESLLYR